MTLKSEQERATLRPQFTTPSSKKLSREATLDIPVFSALYGFARCGGTCQAHSRIRPRSAGAQ